MPTEWDIIPPGIRDAKSLAENYLSETVMDHLNNIHFVVKTSISRGFQLANPITADALDSPLKFSLVTATSRGHRTSSSRSLTGIVTLDGTSPLSLNSASPPLVVLSEAEYLGFGEEGVREYDDEGAHFPLYNVMLVEWKCDERVAKRLGMERVYKAT